MKKVLLCILCMTVFNTMAQEIIPIRDLEMVVDSKLTKSLLFANAQQWASANDPTCSKKIEVNNNENGSIIVNFELKDIPRSGYTKYITYKFRFSVKIDCKDYKYRRIILNPSVLFALDVYVNLNTLSSRTLDLLIKQGEAAEKLSKTYFQNMYNWSLPQLESIFDSNQSEIKNINVELAKIGDSKKMKKMKKELEDKLVLINNENIIINEALLRWNIVFEKITTDIDKELNKNNDF